MNIWIKKLKEFFTIYVVNTRVVTQIHFDDDITGGSFSLFLLLLFYFVKIYGMDSNTALVYKQTLLTPHFHTAVTYYSNNLLSTPKNEANERNMNRSLKILPCIRTPVQQ